MNSLESKVLSVHVARYILYWPSSNDITMLHPISLCSGLR